MNRNILVICALGYATSTMIKKAIYDFITDHGVKNWSVDAIGINMAADYVRKADIIVSSLELKKEDYKVPVFNGVPLISGIGKEAVLNEILAEIKRMDGEITQ